MRPIVQQQVRPCGGQNQPRNFVLGHIQLAARLHQGERLDVVARVVHLVALVEHHHIGRLAAGLVGVAGVAARRQLATIELSIAQPAAWYALASAVASKVTAATLPAPQIWLERGQRQMLLLHRVEVVLRVVRPLVRVVLAVDCLVAPPGGGNAFTGEQTSRLVAVVAWARGGRRTISMLDVDDR